MNQINSSDPTQVSYPWRAALRTGVQALIGVLAALIAIAPLLTDFIESTWPGSPVIAWVAAGAAFAGAIAVLITRVMALDSVNGLLTRLGLGATPKK